VLRFEKDNTIATKKINVIVFAIVSGKYRMIDILRTLTFKAGY
jgi:hypothetical protein